MTNTQTSRVESAAGKNGRRRSHRSVAKPTSGRPKRRLAQYRGTTLLPCRQAKEEASACLRIRHHLRQETHRLSKRTRARVVGG